MDFRKAKKHLVLQQDQSDCGVACLQSVLKYFGGNQSLEKLRELSGTSSQGTTLLGLYEAANQVGFKAEGFETDISGLGGHNEPVILHVLIENRLQHYVICFGLFNDKYIVGDPAKGIVEYTKSDLEAIWKSRQLLTLTPNASFAKTKDINKAKRKFLYDLIREDRALLGASTGIGIGVALLSMVMAVFSQKLIDDILPSNDIRRLSTGLTFVALLLLMKIGISSIREFFMLKQSKDFNSRVIDSFYNSILHLPKSFFDTRKIGELVTRLNDTNRIQGVISTVIEGVIIDGLIAVASLVILYVYFWQVGVIATIAFPVYFALIYRFNTRIREGQKEVITTNALNESHYISSMQGIDVIKNFNQQNTFRFINRMIYGNLQDKVFSLGKLGIRIGLLLSTVGLTFSIGILTYGAFQVLYGHLQLGELMAVISISAGLLPTASSLAMLSIPINEAKITFNRMFEYVNIRSEFDLTEDIKPLVFDSLEFKNVSFRFPGRRAIVEDISLNIKRNQLVSIVGESGSGKSTLGQLVQKFYTCQTGNIILNSHENFADTSTKNWRAVLGVVPQDIHLFDGNVLENIALGEDVSKMEDVIEFCKNYGFARYLEQFPQGYFTKLGEEGVNISGGQKQLIAIARALYKNPQVLLLDEATSALDRFSEKFVISLLGKLKRKMAIIFITHRIHILKSLSDRTYVLDQGKIIAEGSHEALLNTVNLYSDFWNDLAYN